jgi:hypothetical protein
LTENSSEKKSTPSKPKATKGDYAHLLARVGLSAIPVLGGPIKEFFNAAVKIPLSKHLIEWIEELYKEVQELEKKVDSFNLDSLSEDSVFATKFSYAVQLAIRNHQEEKLNALRNSLLNIAINKPADVEEAIQHLFLNYIDAFSIYHLKILKCLDNTKDWFKQNKLGNKKLPSMGGVADLLKIAFPELKREFYDQIVKDLIDKGLLQDFAPHSLMSNPGTVSTWTTDMGKRFLAFITSPILED